MIIKTRWIWIAISSILIILSGFFIFNYKIPYGVDFSGGTVLEFSLTGENINKDKIEEILKNSGVKNINLRTMEQGRYSLKSEELSDETIKSISTKLTEAGEYQESRRETVGPTVSKDLTKKAIYAIIYATIAIIIYIAWSFRSLPKPANSWRFGITAVIALIHDLIITTGAMALYGHFFGYEIDLLFITALLTIMGFSVHDTIVVFDRLRENLRQFPSRDFSENANHAIIQTIVRSLNTSLTVLLTLLALYLLGGDSIKNFVLTLIIGISIGTYSSIFIATVLLVIWQFIIDKLVQKKSAEV